MSDTSHDMARNDSPVSLDGHPRVSIVMSVYNEATRVGKAIESLLCQTFAEFELIIVDDGSQDATPVILEAFRRRDERIRIISQENMGLTKALIRGCHEARGTYIARQDADDWSVQTRLAHQVTLLDSDSTVGFVSCATQVIGPNDELLELVRRPYAPVEATHKLLNERQGPPAHGSVMFRRSVYIAAGGYREEFHFGQDADLWLRMAEFTMVAYSQEVLYHYRRDFKAISGRRQLLQRQFGVLGQACRMARRNGQPETQMLREARRLTNRIGSISPRIGFSRGASSMAYLIGSTLLNQGSPGGDRYLWQAISFNPFNWRAWTRIFLVNFRRFCGRPHCVVND